MASNKVQSTIFAGTVAMAALAGTLALPNLANNPTLLYLAGQVQIAAGHTNDGLSLISRAALATPDNTAPSVKPSPVKSASTCPMTQQKALPKTRSAVPSKANAGTAVASLNQDVFMQHAYPEVPMPPVQVNFDLLPAEALRKMDSREINRRVQIFQERINRQVQKATRTPMAS